MKNVVTWLYESFPGFADFLPPMLLYIGLWAVIILIGFLIAAALCWSAWFLVASVLFRAFTRIIDLCFGYVEFLASMVTRKREIPDQVHPVIQRVVIVEDRTQRQEVTSSDRGD